MHAGVGARVEPRVESQLAVELVGQAAARLEALLHEVLQALNHTLGLRIPRLAECQPTRSQDHTRAIASFTLWDKYAVGTATLSPIVYYWGTNLANAALLTPMARRDREELRQAWTVSRARAVGVGLLSPLAYVLIRYALARAPVSYVAPAREGSIVVGSLLCGVPAALTVLPTEAPLSTA
jgi:hypothetical protein